MLASIDCLGTGLVRFSSPVGSFSVACRGVNQGALSQPTHLRAGQKVVVRVVAASTTRWELWIVGMPHAS